MAVTESDRLLAEGVELHLKGGETAMLVIDFVTFKRLEDVYGSLGAATASLNDDKNFSALLKLLAVCLNVSEDDLLPKLVSQNLREYLAGFNLALAQALPALEPGDASPNAEAAESNGALSTTSPPSDSVALTSNSGG